MKRLKKYIAIFLALLILTSTISSQNVYADQNDTHEVKTTVNEEIMDHSEDTTIAENQVDKDVSEEEKENSETDTTATKADGIEENNTKEEMEKEIASNDDSEQSTDSKVEEENKSEPENEKDDIQEVIQVNTEELSETISDLYGETDFDSSNTYTTKTLIVVSDHSDFDNCGALKMIQYDTMYILQYETEDATKKAYKNLKKDDSIHSVEIDTIVQSMEVDSSEVVEKENPDIEINSELSNYLYTQQVDKNEVKVAVLDSGINYDNEEFNGRLIDLGLNYSSSGSGIKDDFGHGTEVSSIIVENTYSNVKLLPIKVTNLDGKGTLLSLFLGISAAIENDVDIINISLSTYNTAESTLLKSIISEATEGGIIVIASAGNDASDVKNYVPANLDSVVTVGSVKEELSLTDFSNYGESIDYVSLGNNIPCIDMVGNGKKVSGTSFSTAIVTSIFSKIKGIDLSYSSDSIKSILEPYIIDLGDEGKDIYYGNGLLSYYSVVTENSNTNIRPDINPALNINDVLDWKLLSDEMLNDYFFYGHDNDNAYFIQRLNEDDVKLILSKDTILIKGYESEKYDTYYKYLLSIDLTKVKSDTIQGKTSLDRSSGYFYFIITGNGSTSNIKITADVESKTTTKKQAVTYSISGTNNHNFQLTSTTGITHRGTTTSEDQAVDTKVTNDSGAYQAIYYDILHITAKYTIPAHYHASGSTDRGINDSSVGRINFKKYNWENENPSTLDTEYKTVDTVDDINLSINGFSASLYKYDDKYYYGTYTVNLKLNDYWQTVYVRYQNKNGNYGAYDLVKSESKLYGDRFTWSQAAVGIYEGASRNYEVLGTKPNYVDIKINSNVTAVAKPDGEPINGWYKGLPEIKATGKDPNLDIKSVTIGLNSTEGVSATIGATASLIAEEGEKKYKYYATNVNDVNSKEETITIKADNSKPEKISLTAPTEWTNSTVPLTLKGEDTLSGLASFKVYYSSDNNTWSEYGTVICNGETTLKEDSTSIKANRNGYYVLSVTDRVGNEDKSSAITISNIDRSAPTLKYEIEGDKRKNNWYRGDAELNLTASDETGGSGVQSITVNSNLTIGDKRTVEVTKEGANVYICYATDFARNETNPRKEITVKVDKSKPYNLSVTPNTTDWTKNPVVITAKAEDTYSGVDTIELQYTQDNKHPDWKTYKTGALDGANQATYNFSVTDNGYYRMIVTDQVGYQETSDILKVTNYDPDAPDANTIGIEPNTIQWVDESTGVEVTSYGSDELSVLSSVEVMERNGVFFESKKTQKYSGETTIESATYDTHINEEYLTKITDQAGNKLEMLEEDALEVNNIDPEAPELTIESISTQEEFISTQKGYVIRAIIEDTQSGFEEASLQKLNETGEWEDYKAQYQIIRTEEEEESNESAKEIQVDKQEEEPALTKVARERVIVMAASNVYLASSDTKDKEIEEEEREQGETKVILEYTVRENGTYRLRGADLVQNTAYTKDTIEITNLDGSMPVIQVEGNPTVWQNQDAMIKVSATDEDSEISDMTLDGEKKAFLKGEDGAFYFTFDATKNQEFSVSASDEAGNTTTRIIKVTKIDKEAPVLNTTIKKSWLSMIFGNYRNLKLDTNDDLSGIATVVVRHQEESTIVAEYPYENAKISFKGDYKIKEIGDYEVIITDHAGNVTMQTISESNLDFNAPWLKVEGNPTIWQNTDATIKVTAFDEDSAIAKMTLNGIEQEFEIESQGEAVFTFTVTKNEKFLVVAYDEANHATSQVIEVTKIDKEKPTLETLLTARWQEEGYRNLGYEGFDNLSGIATITLEYEGVKETLNSFEYKAEQKITANDYQMTQNGDYLLTIKDHAGNSDQVTVTEKEAKILKAMEVVIPPKKIKYKETEDFKKKGMVVDAIYNNNSRKENIKDYVILDGTNLVLAQGKINLSYTEDGKTVYTDTPIQVIAEPLVAEESEAPVTPEEPTPVTPNTPVSPSPTPVTPTTEKEINEVKKEIKEEPSKVVNEMPENTGVTKEGNQLPMGAILAGLGFLMLLLFLLLLNVKVYNKDEDGEWKFLGKTRAIKAKDQYVVKISRFVRRRAVSNSYQLVVSRMFKKFHEECDLIIKIDEQDYERHLEKESDTVYVEHNE